VLTIKIAAILSVALRISFFEEALVPGDRGIVDPYEGVKGVRRGARGELALSSSSLRLARVYTEELSRFKFR
jgi:hypothetical protein